MSTKKKLLQAAAGAAGGAGLDVDEVFSTYLYEGNGSTGQSIVNGIDLSGEGGLVWAKSRDSTSNPSLYDTERGAQKPLFSNATSAEGDDSSGGATKGLYQFNNNGFTLGDDWAAAVNLNNDSHVSWTFRKAPKFFDCIKYQGTTADKTINHNLGTTVGAIFIKSLDNSRYWWCTHRGLNGGTNWWQYDIHLNTTDAQSTEFFGAFMSEPSSTSFTLRGGKSEVNANGENYIAYLFAHNNSDGDFGPDADQDIIKCGSYTGTGASGHFIDLGFEPQWLLIKRTDAASNWELLDVIRGMPAGGEGSYLRPNKSNAEATSSGHSVTPSPTGFTIDSTSNINGLNDDFMYVAIRRGPLAEPESATDVFAIDQRGGTSPTPPMFNSGFVTDFAIWFNTATNPKEMNYRLSQNVTLDVNATSAEHSQSNRSFDYMNGWGDFTSSNTSQYAWMWKRAPSFCDVVSYTGTGSAATINHNLGVAPEMMWVKCRSSGGDWIVYHTGSDSTNPSHKYLELNDTASVKDTAVMWNDTEPTSSVFSIGTNSDVNASGATYVAFLFATVAGVSKVGSYTGTGTAGLNVDCGFSSGARFVLIKKATGTASYWAVFDSTRGIVAGNDPFLRLNDTTAETTSIDAIDPYSAGFTVATDFSFLNNSGDTYIFYAIA